MQYPTRLWKDSCAEQLYQHSYVGSHRGTGVTICTEVPAVMGAVSRAGASVAWETSWHPEVAPLSGVRIKPGMLCGEIPAWMGALDTRSLAGAQCPGQGSAAWVGRLYLCCAWPSLCGQPLQLCESWGQAW